ncbi:diguanylate cyclase [Pedobacter changchengzhani]|uniref:Diguanylate cyclase n=1 Tax=Pedobacter changchengzhani TaxID=2529274 RepID=A0A4R5MMG0_9SPHI|nr:sensor histidine kinase [Pedobacter changchengzhani]TDG36921.1 diguanylate cyclase [Pedobacter changchengzhani]
MLIFTTVSSFAQRTYLQHFTTKNGLPSNNCYYILQDKRGFIWIATDGGLSRFDGANFQNFSIEDGLPDTQILQLKEDRQGKLWFLTLNGQLGYLDNGKFYNQNNDTLLKQLNFNTIIVSFLQDNKGNIWLGTNTNLIVKWDGKSIKKYTSKYPNEKFANAFLHEDGEGNIFSFSNKSTQKFDGKNFTIVPEKVDLLSYRSAINTPAHALFYLDETGLKYFKKKVVTEVLKINQKLIKNISGYFYYDESAKQVWLSNNNGAFVIDKNNKTTSYLDNISVNQTIKDNTNNMWFATSDGVYMLPNVNARLFVMDKESGLTANVIKSIAKDENNKLWLGTNNASINILNLNNFTINDIQIPDEEKFKSISQLTYDKKNKSMFFSSEFGLGAISDTNLKNPSLKYLKEENGLMFVIKHFSLNQKDNKFALALSTGVIYANDRINNFNINLLNYSTENDFLRERSYHVFYDRDGSLWFSNLKGLWQYGNGSLIRHYERNILLTKRINDIMQLPDGTLVLATDGYGVIFYKDNIITKQLSKSNGLSSNICKKLFVKNNEIWILTNTGVNKISDYTKNPKIINFDYGKDLLTDDVNNLYIDDSTAYFATNKGLVYFNYSDKQTLTSTPKIYITSIIKGKQRLPLNSSLLKFDYNNNTILFTFSAVDFTTSDITYRYRLNDDAEWVETKTRRLDFSSLQPGDYAFEVSAKNQNGNWSQTAKIPFTIEKPFWQSIWFLGLLVLLIGYLFYKTAVYITRKQKDKEQEQLLVKNKILMLEQQALQAMMNPHFVFNVMNSIQHYINTQNTASANKVLTGFARLIRKNLEICTKSYISLDEELEYLNLYLKLEENRFGNKLQYNIYVDPAIDKDETLIPSMLLQPYVENAIWHGIMPKEAGGKIQINIKIAQPDHLNIEIIDDGIGIDNSRSTKKTDHVSKGMQLTKERLMLLSQIEAKPIQLNVFQTSNFGTTVFISIPLK